MNQHSHLPRNSAGLTMALALVAALLSVFPLRAAAPPAQAREIPGPGPLFGLDEIHTNPIHMALAVFAAGAMPGSGWAATATVYVGEHPRVRAWKLDGVMTNLWTRRACGAGTLFLNGFTSDPAGTSVLVQLATLKAGHYLDCWALRDTDRFHTLPKELLASITDNRGIPVGGLEADTYSVVLRLANYTSANAFKKAARLDITYAHMFSNPDDYRGQVVHIEAN